MLAAAAAAAAAAGRCGGDGGNEDDHERTYSGQRYEIILNRNVVCVRYELGGCTYSRCTRRFFLWLVDAC